MKKQVRVLLAGGGSGGHVTPLKAIYDNLDANSVSTRVIVDRGFSAQTRTLFNGEDVTIKTIFAGKYRRYQSKSVLWHLTHLPTLLKNVRDIVLLLLGFVQSLAILVSYRPDVVFCKGGFVCVPVGLAAHLLRVPLVIHDSDARPGLTNRILSRWAQRIGTGMPTDFYPYDASKTSYTGIPVDRAFRPVSQKKQQEYKQQLGFSNEQSVLLVTGGGNGADSLNQKVSEVVGDLLADGWGIVHLAGKGKTGKLLKQQRSIPEKVRENWRIEEFADMVPCMLAADVVLTRTSASTLQECANARKCVIGVPSPHLDDQAMNAQFFASKQAIIAVDQTELSPQELLEVIASVVGNRGEDLATTLHGLFARPSAAADITRLLLEVARSTTTTVK